MPGGFYEKQISPCYYCCDNCGGFRSSTSFDKYGEQIGASVGMEALRRRLRACHSLAFCFVGVYGA